MEDKGKEKKGKGVKQTKTSEREKKEPDCWARQGVPMPRQVRFPPHFFLVSLTPTPCRATQSRSCSPGSRRSREARKSQREYTVPWREPNIVILTCPRRRCGLAPSPIDGGHQQTLRHTARPADGMCWPGRGSSDPLGGCQHPSAMLLCLAALVQVITARGLTWSWSAPIGCPLAAPLSDPF